MENEGDSARECKEMRTLGLSKAFETEAINAQIKDLEDEMAMSLAFCFFYLKITLKMSLKSFF